MVPAKFAVKTINIHEAAVLKIKIPKADLTFRSTCLASIARPLQLPTMLEFTDMELVKECHVDIEPSPMC